MEEREGEKHCPFKRCQNALAMIGLQGRKNKKEVIITISVGMYPRPEGASSILVTGRWEEASKLEVQKGRK